MKGMDNHDPFDLPEVDRSIPAIIDELDSSAPLVKRLKTAGPEVVAMLDSLLEEVSLPPESVEWVVEDEVAKEILGAVRKISDSRSEKIRQQMIDKIVRLISENG